MTVAIEAYKNATTREEAIEAFEVLMEVIASDLDLDDDADFRSYAEKALNDMGVEITHSTEWADPVPAYDCARFDISEAEHKRIAAAVVCAEDFRRVWESTDWWTDANNVAA